MSKMKSYELDVYYSTSIMVELPYGVDLEKINKEIKQCDEFLQDPGSEFEGIIQRNGGEIVSPNWGWKTYPSKLDELTEEESNGSYKGEF